MKSKATTYILIAAVLGVWGFILMKIFSSLSDNSDMPVTAKKTFKEQPVNLSFYSSKKTGTLLLDYADPMLRDLAVRTTDLPMEPALQNPVNDYIPPAPVEMEPQIDVQYLGFIENLEDKRPTAIVNIQGMQYMMNNGERQSGVHLVSINKEYLKIKIGDKTKTIYKNEN